MKITDKYVFFWGEEPFTNFTFCPNLTYLGLKWESTEQLFMWIKAVEFKDYQKAQEIRKAKTPREAKKLGREVKNFDAKHWTKVSNDYMKTIVELKFRLNPKFLKTLLNPDFFGKTFVEASPYDRIWGIGYRASVASSIDETRWGENRLGRILTDLRNKLLQEYDRAGKENVDNC